MSVRVISFAEALFIYNSAEFGLLPSVPVITSNAGTQGGSELHEVASRGVSLVTALIVWLRQRSIKILNNSERLLGDQPFIGLVLRWPHFARASTWVPCLFRFYDDGDSTVEEVLTNLLVAVGTIPAISKRARSAAIGFFLKTCACLEPITMILSALWRASVHKGNPLLEWQQGPDDGPEEDAPIIPVPWPDPLTFLLQAVQFCRSPVLMEISLFVWISIAAGAIDTIAAQAIMQGNLTQFQYASGNALYSIFPSGGLVPYIASGSPYLSNVAYMLTGQPGTVVQYAGSDAVAIGDNPS